MAKLVLAAKITHVPSMYLSEMPGKHHGCRQAAIDGHIEISRRCRELDVETIVVFDTHWLVNSAFHINCYKHFEGVYTSNELPHFIHDMEYDVDGNPELGVLIGEEARARGVRAKDHQYKSLELEYGTLVPMRYMNKDKKFKVVSVAALLTSHFHEDSVKFGEAVLAAIERYEGGNVAVLASGSLSHLFIDDHRAEKYLDKYSREFDHAVDEAVMKMWENGEFDRFAEMVTDYDRACYGEGHMHDTVMLLGMLGWDKYKEKAEVITPLFASSGTGQANVIFPIPEHIKARYK